MKKEFLQPKGDAPLMGFYSPGIAVDIGNAKLVFVTGQIAQHQDGTPVAPKDFGKQTEYIFETIKKILAEANGSIDDVVKAVIYTTDISKFKEISAIRNKYFATARPVSTMVEISKTVRDGCDVEIEVIAVLKK